MQIENILLLFQLKKVKSKTTKQKDKTKLFVKIKNGNRLLGSEIQDEETFKENTKKEMWKNFNIDDFIYIDGMFYDNFKNKFNERICQKSSICLLKSPLAIDEEWFEITFLQNKISFTSATKTFSIHYRKEINENYIVSANTMLSDNHSQLLLDATLKLKTTFLMTDLFCQFVDDTFPISEAIDLFNAFSEKPFSRATFKRRFSGRVAPFESDNGTLYKKLYQ